MTTIDCISPIDGSLVASKTPHSKSQMADIIKRAQIAQRQWAKTPLNTRIAYIGQYLHHLTQMNGEIVPELARQMGRPVRFGGELRPLTERTNYMMNLAPSALAPLTPSDSQDGINRYIERVPLGLVMVIAPWNYPFITANNTIITALMAGNAVLLKHSAQTILVGDRIARAMELAGLPADLFHHVYLTHELSAEIGRAHV